MSPKLKDDQVLTRMQGRILEAIQDFIENHDFPPTVRELGEEFGLKSSTVFAHLKALEKKNFITRAAGKSRGIQLVSAKPSGIPLLGHVMAGPPDLAVEQRGEYIDVDANYFGAGQMFALRIQGDSMIDAGILEGDTVIVKQCDDANDGEIVVALIENEATVKTLRKKAGAVMLEPANSRLEPFFFGPGDPVPQIMGKVVGVMRKL